MDIPKPLNLDEIKAEFRTETTPMGNKTHAKVQIGEKTFFFSCDKLHQAQAIFMALAEFRTLNSFRMEALDNFPILHNFESARNVQRVQDHVYGIINKNNNA